MNKHLQIIRDLRERIELDPTDTTAYKSAGRFREGGLEVVARLDLIEALRECEYLLQIGDSVHKNDLR